MKKRSYRIVRADGKAYFGRLQLPTNGKVTLHEAVELVTTMGMTRGGIQKQVLVVGLDYCSGPLKALVIQNPGPSYWLDDMPEKDSKVLMQDYQNFLTQENLVKPPPTPGIVAPK